MFSTGNAGPGWQDALHFWPNFFLNSSKVIVFRVEPCPGNGTTFTFFKFGNRNTISASALPWHCEQLKVINMCLDQRHLPGDVAT